MGETVRLRVGTAGLTLEFSGDREVYEDLVRDLVAPVAGGSRRVRLAVEAPPLPEAAPSPAPPAPAPAALPFDPAPLYAALAKEDVRRAERDAVLLALVALAAGGKRDAAPAEITAHLAAHGFPSKDLKARPILAKLSARKGLVAPGILPNTWRATPAGVAHVLRRGRGN